jgi:hypothetical protein
MQAEGVKRLICVTGFGAGDSRERMADNALRAGRTFI